MRPMTVSRLSDQYVQHARTWVKPSTGAVTGSWRNVKAATDHLRRCPLPPAYASKARVIGDLPADQMSAKLLYHLQQHMAQRGQHCRGSINDVTKWVKTMYRWAAHPVQELVPEEVPARLSLVGALKRGRSPAFDPPPVRSVTLAQVQATALYAPPKLALMMLVQWHTGMRPGELVLMSKSTIDTSASPWLYWPASHKTEHYGQARVIALPRVIQPPLRAWMDHAATDCLWQGLCHGEPTGKPMRRTSYSNAIMRINRLHRLDAWSPNQVRHAYATRVAAALGETAAQRLLGHTSLKTTQGYIDPDTRAMMDLADRLDN